MTDWLLDTLVWTSLLMILVLAVREPVRRQFGAGVAYALWLLPAARIAMPTLTHTVERPAPDAPIALAPATEAAPLLVDRPVAIAPALEAAAPSLVEQLGGWPVILLAVWLGGAAVLFANRMLAYARIREGILSVSTPAGRIGSVRIVRSDAVDGPLAFGVIDKVVAVPAHFMTHYTPEERRLALAHEFAHHRSGDLLANLIAFVLLSLQWFNPLAWTSYAAFRFDQEAACDARVLGATDDPAAYGRAIAKAASGRALLFASALDRKSTLKRRLSAMMNKTPTTRRRAGNLLVLGCVAAALPLTATKAVDYVETHRDAPAGDTVTETDRYEDAMVEADADLDAMQEEERDERHIEIDIPRDKPYSQMTAEEREAFDEGLAEMREALAELKQERLTIDEEIRVELAEARADIDEDEMRAELEEALADIDEEMAEIDAEAAELRASGVDPETIKASLRAAKESIRAIDVQAITQSALASINPEMIRASVETGMAEAERQLAAELKRMEAQRLK